jgi:hypothetical protein
VGLRVEWACAKQQEIGRDRDRRGEQGRLADPRLSGDHNGAGASEPRVVEQCPQAIEFVCTADKHRLRLGRGAGECEGG